MVDAFEQLPADASKKSVRSASTGIDSAKAHASRMSLQSKHELLSDTLPTQITANQSSRRPRGKVCVRGDGIGFQCCDSACQPLAKSDNSIWQPFAVCIGLQVLLGASAPPLHRSSRAIPIRTMPATREGPPGGTQAALSARGSSR